MPKMLDDQFRLMFAPDAWSPMGKFKSFLGPPFVKNSTLTDSIQALSNRINRFETLASLANRIHPTLLDDIAELEKSGFTPANRSSELAALIENLFCDLYSVLDSLRYVIFGAYSEHRGVQKKSTSKLFSSATNKKYGDGFPEPIRALLDDAYRNWFIELRTLRTEFTHGSVGSCSMDKKTHAVSYMNRGLSSGSDARVIENIIEKLNEFTEAVFGLVRAIGDFMYSQLQTVESIQFCGIYRGRIYTRTVTPEPNLNRQSGICAAKSWFEKEPEHACPLSKDCTAYARAVAL